MKSAVFAIALLCSCSRVGEITFDEGSPHSESAPISVSEELRHAAVQWNSRARCELFRVAASPDVVVIYDIAPDDGLCIPGRHVACTYWQPPSSWVIHYPSPSTIDVQAFVLTHELGHVLGLAHDRAGPSIMQPSVHREPSRGAVLWIDRADISAVRSRYCSE